jgi:hypothetical protein
MSIKGKMNTETENKILEKYTEYIEKLKRSYVCVKSLQDKRIRILKNANRSRYFGKGRTRIKARIKSRMGRWFYTPGVILTLTFAPDLISRENAWTSAGKMVREFMNRLNQARRNKNKKKLSYIAVIEEQTGTGYPHYHIVFPGLKWLGEIKKINEIWGQAENSVDVKYRDNIELTGYICKYVTKVSGWSELGLAYIWNNKTRLYRLSRDYTLPQYDNRVVEWQFIGSLKETDIFDYIDLNDKYYEILLN